LWSGIALEKYYGGADAVFGWGVLGSGAQVGLVDGEIGAGGVDWVTVGLASDHVHSVT
jgi:hypothetical protein